MGECPKESEEGSLLTGSDLCSFLASSREQLLPWGRNSCVQFGGRSSLWRLGGQRNRAPVSLEDAAGESLAKESAYLNVTCPKFFLMILFWQAVIRGCFQGVILATPALPRAEWPPSHAGGRRLPS